MPFMQLAALPHFQRLKISNGRSERHTNPTSVLCRMIEKLIDAISVSCFTDAAGLAADDMYAGDAGSVGAFQWIKMDAIAISPPIVGYLRLQVRRAGIYYHDLNVVTYEGKPNK
jgi:hypothetical protein